MRLSEEDLTWLKQQAERIISEASHTGADGRTFYFPEPGLTYPSMWTRDFTYMYTSVPELFDPEVVEAIYFYIVSKQHADGLIPDRIDADGTAIYLILGKKPPTDNSQFLVELCYALVTNTGKTGIFERSAESLERALAAIPRNPKSGLVWIDTQTPHSSYGFTDVIMKTGEELFCSLLYFDAANKLSELYSFSGNKDKTRFYHNEAHIIRKGISIFWNNKYNLLNAATHTGAQPDIWGSAFAIYVGILSAEDERKVCRSLFELYPQYTKRGQFRHILEGMSWQGLLDEAGDFRYDPAGKSTDWVRDLARADEYQNGGYWATPVSWMCFALGNVSEELVEKTYTELLTDFRSSGIYECVNDNYAKCKDYVASVTNPIPGLKEALQKHGASVNRKEK